MRKSFAAMALTATALVTLPALAQTNPPTNNTPTSSAPANKPAATSAASSPASGDSSRQYMTEEAADQWRASKLVGLGVYNEQNEKVGNINELLFNKDGRVEGVVIAVGGFLGIGEHYVAVPYNAVQWSMTSDTKNTSATSAASSPAAGTTTPTTTTTTGTAAPANRSTASNTPAPADPTGAASPNTSALGSPATAPNGAPTGAAPMGDTSRTARTDANPNPAYPDHAILANASKDELKNAPEFKWGSAPR